MCRFAVASAAPQFPEISPCIYAGTGEIVLSGNWKAHPIFNKYDQRTTFRFRGLRADGFCTTRYTTDFGEASGSFADDGTSATFWYRGDDQVLKGVYDDVHMFQYALNPLSYLIMPKLSLEHAQVSPVQPDNPNSVAYRIGTREDPNGSVSTDYIIAPKNGQVQQFTIVDHWNYPNAGLNNVTYEQLDVRWSEPYFATQIPTQQVATIATGNRGPKPQMTVTINTNISSLELIKPAEIAKAQEDLVSGLFRYEGTRVLRRASTSNSDATNSARWPKILAGFGAAVLLLSVLVLRRRNKNS